MAVLSRFSRVLSQAKPFIFAKQLKNTEKSYALLQAYREMSGGGDHPNTMHITPSRFQYSKFKDDLHFHISLGIIFFGSLIFFVNIFIGPAELTEIPEGYIPKHWEYYRHPIQRFISRHMHHDPQVEYEKVLHHMAEIKDRYEYKEKCDKVKYLMATRDDYKGWFFIPSDRGRLYRYARYEEDTLDDKYGYR